MSATESNTAPAVPTGAPEPPQLPTEPTAVVSAGDREAKREDTGEHRVFLGGLPYRIQKDEIEQMFSKYGPVRNVYTTDRGFAFVVGGFVSHDGFLCGGAAY